MAKTRLEVIKDIIKHTNVLEAKPKAKVAAKPVFKK